VTEQAAVQLRRLLAVIPHLADGEEHSLADVAGEIGTDAETVLRDLRAISVRFDEPGGFVEGVQIFIESDAVSLLTNHFHRPMRLTRGELGTLELGLAMLKLERPPEEHATIDRARERLRAALAGLPADEGDGLRRAANTAAAGDARILSRLRHAVRERAKARLTYRAATDAESTERVVRPYGLVAARGAWFAIAYCERAEGLRVFRVDRIGKVDVEPETFEADQDFSLDELIRDGRVFSGSPAATLRVRYAPRIARWIAEREHVTPDENGAVIVEHPLADEDWAVRHVLQYGPDVDILEPESVRVGIRDRLSRIISAS
jgi:predicted DNA-binding transcriptional regulator YafY